MSIKLGQIFAAKEAIVKLNSMDLPVKYAVKLGRDLIRLDNEYKLIEECRNKLIKKYGTEQDDKSIAVTDEKKPAFFLEFNAFLDQDTEVELTKIKISDLDESVKLSGSDVATLIEVGILTDE